MIQQTALKIRDDFNKLENNKIINNKKTNKKLIHFNN